MDEEIKAAEEAVEASNAEPQIEESEVNTLEESPTPEETPEEITEEASEEVETEGEPRKGAQSRIKELVRERNEAEARAKSLADRLEEISGGGQQPDYNFQIPQPQPDEPIVKPGEEIDIVEFEKRLREREARNTQQLEARFELRNKQNEAVARINNEARQALSAYPQLNPDNKEAFDQELSETITEAVEAQVRANPYSASVKTFVDKLMKPYTRGVSKEVGKASENIAKQVSQAALRPSSIRKPEKNANEKSIAELEQELGIVQF